MAPRDEILKHFINNPLTAELCSLDDEELSNVSFSSGPTNDPLINALRRLIISAVENGDTSTTSIKNVNILLKSQS
jgi:hypothetical protein